MWCAAYLGVALLAGYAVVGRFAARASRIERFGLSACLGTGLLGLCMIGLSMLGLRPSRAEIIVLAALFAILALSNWRPDTRETNEIKASLPTYLKVWTAICLGAIAYAVMVEATQALAEPTTEWDAFAIWQLKAKVLAGEALYPKPAYFSNVALGYSHLKYPVLMPMISAGVHAMTERIDDGLEKAPSLLLFIGLGAAVYAAVRRFSGHAAAITMTALLLNLPAFYRYGCSGTAEMALTAFYGCSIICLLHWQQSDHWGDLILAALFSACAAWTKDEGIPLAAINAVVIFGRMRPPKSLARGLVFILIVAILIVPWLLYVRGIPRADEDYANGLTVATIAANLSRLPVILRTMGLEFVDWRQWGILWVAAPALAVLRWHGFDRRAAGTLWALGLLHLMVYVLAYLATRWDIYDLLPVTMDRLLLHVSPVGAMLIGVMWGPAD